MSQPASGEFARIARLAQIYARSAPGVRVGIGDDCAVLAASPHERVWTIDAAVEGVHFDRAFMSPFDIGYRAFMAAASDVAAMGARVDGALSALVVPRDFTEDTLDALAHGTAEAARLCGSPVVGGNLARGNELSITTSVLGSAEGRAVLRSGAHPGDGVFVTGALGGAALGLRALAAGRREALFSASIERFLRPRARLDKAPLIARHASAAIDVSDGLVQDLAHVARASGVTLALTLADVPLELHFAEACAALGLDPDALALGGGEDYELAFCAPVDAVRAGDATRIGSVLAGPGEVTVRARDGGTHPLSAGFDHFR